MKTPYYRIIKSDEYITVPWKNGGGTSRLIILEPGDTTINPDRFLWQAGIADIDRDGPFSDFTGYERIFTLVSGNGITLDAGENGVMNVAHCFQPERFSGDWQVEATLHDGPAEAFNIVCDRARAKATVEMTDALALAEKLDRKSSVFLIHNFSDAPLEVGSVEEASIELTPGDTLIFYSLPERAPKISQSTMTDRLAFAQIRYL